MKKSIFNFVFVMFIPSLSVFVLFPYGNLSRVVFNPFPFYLFTAIFRFRSNIPIISLYLLLSRRPTVVASSARNLSRRCFNPSPQAAKTRLNSVFKRVSWRRWRDSNSRGAFDPYTISSCLIPFSVGLYISLLLSVIFKKTYEHFYLLSGYFFCFFLSSVLPAARRRRRRRRVVKNRVF